jgi:hypothetical protein
MVYTKLSTGRAKWWEDVKGLDGVYMSSSARSAVCNSLHDLL